LFLFPDWAAVQEYAENDNSAHDLRPLVDFYGATEVVMVASHSTGAPWRTVAAARHAGKLVLVDDPGLALPALLHPFGFQGDGGDGAVG